MTITVAADLVVAVLLAFTIYYAVKLNRRLAGLRADRDELQALVQHLAAASASAEAGVQGLKSAAEDIGRQLEKRMQEAQSLRDDLTYMMERGGTLADQLEGTIRARRDAGPTEPAAPRPNGIGGHREPTLSAARLAAKLVEEPARAAGGAPSRAERDLLRVLGGRR